MIEHVYERAAAAPGIDAVVVATDDERIAAAVTAFGGVVRMTRSSHRTGLDRIAEVAADLRCELVVGVQGDEPAIDPRAIAAAIEPLISDPTVQMSTLRCRLTDRDDISSRHVVKVVVDLDGNALYFSRSPIPYVPPEPVEAGPHDGGMGGGFSRLIYKHIGLYAYRRAVVGELASLPQTPLEIAESLEQLRALEHGFRIRAVETQYDSIGVDTPEDLERVRRQMTAGARA